MTMDRTYDEAPSRYEMNRLVGNVLTRHRANLELISISCTGRIVYLSGTLTKTAKQDFKPVDVEVIFREIEQIPMVRSIDADLDNWSVSGAASTGARLIIPRRRVPRAAAPADAPDHKIGQSEKITDVLDDMKKSET